MVADPQLVGLQDESQTFGFITRWDQDRSVSLYRFSLINCLSIHSFSRILLLYCCFIFSSRHLSRSFSHAVSHVDPDVILFLGDLIDEGTKANQDEYESYFARFNAIFSSSATVNPSSLIRSILYALIIAENLHSWG
jgi:hypothetical protein